MSIFVNISVNVYYPLVQVSIPNQPLNTVTVQHVSCDISTICILLSQLTGPDRGS